MKEYKTIQVQSIGAHVDLVFMNALNGPPVINLEMVGELENAVEEIAEDPSIRSVSLWSENNKTFLAGTDLGEILDLANMDQGRAYAERMRRVLEALEALPVPVIAVIEGDVYGGGCDVVLAADIRLMAESANMTFSHGRYGLITAWGGITRLVHRIGTGRTMYLVATGRPTSARRAYEMNLVEELVAEGEDMADHVASMRATIESIGSRALRAAKQAVLSVAGPLRRGGFERELDLFSELWGSPEQIEGVRAHFLNRAPDGFVPE